MRLVCCFVVSISVAACAKQQMPLADVAVIKAADGSGAGIDIYSERRLRGEQVPKLRGNQIVEIRTHLPRIDDFGREVAGDEIAGATCEAILDTHRATVRTPGAIHVPIYGYVTAPFSVTCDMDGFQRSIQAFEPYNKTIADRRSATTSAGAAGGLLGALVATVVVEGINASSDVTEDQFQYASPPILMRSGPSIASANSAEMAAPTQALASAPSATSQPQPTTTATLSNPAAPNERQRPKFERDNGCSPWCPRSYQAANSQSGFPANGNGADSSPAAKAPVLAQGQASSEAPASQGDQLAQPKNERPKFERDSSCSPWCKTY